jgi:hypothetical protein
MAAASRKAVAAVQLHTTKDPAKQQGTGLDDEALSFTKKTRKRREKAEIAGGHLHWQSFFFIFSVFFPLQCGQCNTSRLSFPKQRK